MDQKYPSVYFIALYIIMAYIMIAFQFDLMSTILIPYFIPGCPYPLAMGSGKGRGEGQGQGQGKGHGQGQGEGSGQDTGTNVAIGGGLTCLLVCCFLTVGLPMLLVGILFVTVLK